MSIETSVTWIAICQIIITLMVFLTAAALIFVLIKFKKLVSDKVDEALSRVQPIVDQTREIAEQAKDTAEKVSEKVDSIMTKAETTATKVTERMDNVTAKVQESVSPQAVNIAGYVAAGLKALQLFKDISAARSASSEQKHHHAHTDEDAGAHI